MSNEDPTNSIYDDDAPVVDWTAVHLWIDIYAHEHYDEDGWDFYVECWDVAQLMDFCNTMCPSATDPVEIRKVVGRSLKIQDEYRRAIRNA